MNILRISNNCCPKPKFQQNFGAQISPEAQAEIDKYLAAHKEERDAFAQIADFDDVSIGLDKFKLNNLKYLVVKKIPDCGYRLLLPLNSISRLKDGVERFHNDPSALFDKDI